MCFHIMCSSRCIQRAPCPLWEGEIIFCLGVEQNTVHIQRSQKTTFMLMEFHMQFLLNTQNIQIQSCEISCNFPVWKFSGHTCMFFQWWKSLHSAHYFGMLFLVHLFTTWKTPRQEGINLAPVMSFNNCMFMHQQVSGVQ